MLILFCHTISLKGRHDQIGRAWSEEEQGEIKAPSWSWLRPTFNEVAEAATNTPLFCKKLVAIKAKIRAQSKIPHYDPTLAAYRHKNGAGKTIFGT